MNTYSTKAIPKRRGSDFDFMARGDSLPGHVRSLRVCTTSGDKGVRRRHWSVRGRSRHWIYNWDPGAILLSSRPDLLFPRRQVRVSGPISRKVLHTATCKTPPWSSASSGCRASEYQGQTLDPFAMALTRTMAPARQGHSIWFFVCIHYAMNSAADDLVKIWRLNVPVGNQVAGSGSGLSVCSGDWTASMRRQGCRRWLSFA
jgi:hypothetical protein